MATISSHCGRKRHPGSIRGHCRNDSTTWLSFWVTDQACFHLFKTYNHNTRLHNVVATFGQTASSPITQPARLHQAGFPTMRTTAGEWTQKYKGLFSVAMVTRKPQVPRQHVYRVAVSPNQKGLPKVFGFLRRCP